MLILAVAIALPAMAAQDRQASTTFAVEDYFRLKRVSELALSPDGSTVAYVVEQDARPPADETSSQASEDTQVVSRSVYVAKTGEAAEPAPIAALARAHALSWIPGRNEIAFLAPKPDVTQLFSYDPSTQRVRQLTGSTDDVDQYRFTADGSGFAYSTLARTPPSASLYQRLRSEKAGIVIDEKTTKAYDYLDPQAGGKWQPGKTALWIAMGDKQAREVPLPGSVFGSRSGQASFAWSSRGNALSVTYVSNDVPVAFIDSLTRTSVGVFDLETGEFRAVGKSAEAAAGNKAVRYLGGDWLPGEDRLIVRRYTVDGPWGSNQFQEWTIAGAVDNAVADPRLHWRPIELYSGAGFMPRSGSEIYLENTVEGSIGLFRWNGEGEGFAEVPSKVPGSNEKFCFSHDFATVAFVNESLTRPQEIYVSSNHAAPVRLTRLNDDVAGKVAYASQSVQWKSRDGVVIKGWLLTPTHAKAPYPMLVHVHGGPGIPMTDTFAPYFRLWPYPFEMQASRGMAIFLPNYRGTATYGRAIAFPSELDREPVDDVLSGVESLVESGVADRDRIGMTGHSHGAWLGPVAMTRSGDIVFRASSFAEGTSNNVANYLMMSSELNRYTHDPLMGGSLFDSSERYVESSPDLHFGNVKAATLLEAGGRSLPLGMVGYFKAARYFGIPSEFVVYPNTGHNPNLPGVKREIAVRNLDWFDYWIGGHQDPAPEKAEQYKRWAALRALEPQSPHP